jgi:hypothetical protein
MSAPNKEQFRNEAVNTIAEDLDNSETVVTVSDGSVFPSSGNFRVRVDDEIMICTSRSTNDLTVIRGQESTSAVTHSNGAAISLVLTAASIDRHLQDYDFMVGYSQPALAKLVDDDGSTLLTAASFTDVNAGGSDSKTDQNGTILLRKATQAGVSAYALVRTAPSTPYLYIGAFRALLLIEATSVDKATFGMCFRESSTGKLTTLEIGTEGTASGGPRYLFWSVVNRSGPTSAGTVIAGSPTFNLVPIGCNAFWQRIEDDGTNLKFYLSMDGVNWIQIHSVGRTTHMAGGPNQVGWYVDNASNSKEILVRLAHWSKE